MDKILITGGTGFVGANFARRLVGRGEEVHLIVREGSDFSRIEDIKTKLFLHTADIASRESVDEVFNGVKPQIVLHFAIHGAGAAKDRDDAIGTVSTNLLGTINLADAFAQSGGKCFVNVGSSSEYGIKKHPISEDDILEPTSLYAITKAAATHYCTSLAKHKKLPMVTLRLFSPFGPFEGEGKLVSSVVGAALDGGKFEAPSPDIVRDLIYMDDVINAFDAAINNIQNIGGEVINIGSGEQHSIAQIVAAAQKISGLKFEVIYGNLPLSESEPKMWVADISMAKKRLRWKPEHTFEDGLAKYIEWAKNNAKK